VLAFLSVVSLALAVCASRKTEIVIPVLDPSFDCMLKYHEIFVLGIALGTGYRKGQPESIRMGITAT
jgi:hypothetical protein